MKKSIKSIFAVLFALVMVITVFPLSASAAVSDKAQEIIDAKNNYSSSRKYVDYNGSNLKKGTEVKFESTLYTVTFKVTEVKGSKVTFKANIKGKFGDSNAYRLYFDYSWNLTDSTPSATTITKTIDTNEAYGGTHYLVFSAYGGLKDIADSCGLSNDDYLEVKNAFDGDGYFEYKHYICFGVKEKVTLSGAADVTKNSVTLGDYAWDYHNEYGKAIGFDNIKASGTVVYYKPTSAKKWKSKKFKSGSTMKLTKLKAGTKYTVKCKYYTTIVDPETDKNITTYCDYYNTFDIFTASAKPLKVKKIKVSKYKVTSYKQNAYFYWSGNKWTYVPEKTIKSKVYKVTVKVSNVPKNTKGIMLKVNSDVNTGRYVKFKKNKKTYTFTVAEPLKRKGKKRTAKVYAVANGDSSWGVGLSPAATKKIKIRK